jgi:beta-mannanase
VPNVLPSSKAAAALVAAVALTLGTGATPAAAAPRTPPVAKGIGVSVEIDKLPEFIARTGTRPEVYSVFAAWSLKKPFDARTAEKARKQGMRTSVTWEPWDPRGDLRNQPRYTLKRIAGGSFDGYVRAYARSVKRYRHPVTIRLAHEMNGHWYPWGTTNGNRAADYRAAWRHVHHLFRVEHVRNVTWEWAPNVLFEGSPALRPFYPGDRFVDQVGLSGYNWGRSSTSSWQSFAQIYDTSLRSLRTIAPTKRVWLSEVASARQGGNRSAWVADLFRQVRGRPYIAGLVWFNRRVPVRDWRLESDASVLAEWRRQARRGLRP